MEHNNKIFIQSDKQTQFDENFIQENKEIIKSNKQEDFDANFIEE